ncbi:MAG: hypothetical protein ACI37P_02765 [Eggerthellaceae bacterium]
MKVFLGLKHSHEYWMRYGMQPPWGSYGSSRLAVPKPTRARPPYKKIPDTAAIKELGLPAGLSGDAFHLMVADKESVTKTSSFYCTIWDAPNPGAFTKIDDIYHILSPEACFVMVAHKYANHTIPRNVAILKAALYGFMLCGRYATNPLSGETNYGRHALTTPEKLTSFANRCNAISGIAIAKKALKLVLPNAASPAEAKLALSLCAPSSLGGHNLPKPTLNAEVSIPSPKRRGFGKNKYVCDFLWEGTKKIALEYDSELYHTGKLRIAQDTTRRNNLLDLGITVYGATSEQTRNPEAIELLAKQISKGIGHRHVISMSEFSQRKYELWRTLYSGKG